MLASTRVAYLIGYPEHIIYPMSMSHACLGIFDLYDICKYAATLYAVASGVIMTVTTGMSLHKTLCVFIHIS